jgi:hypothetical protein
VDFKFSSLWGWFRIRKKYGEIFFATWTTLILIEIWQFIIWTSNILSEAGLGNWGTVKCDVLLWYKYRM